MTQEEFKAKVSMAYNGSEQWEQFLEDVWQLHLQDAPRWISVDDELPRMRDMSGQTENVLVYCDNGRIEVTYFDYGDGRFAVGYHLNVTHWMPTPLPPSSSEKPNNCEKGGEEI